MRSLLGAAIDEEADVTLVDMEAGLEHLSRSGGTLAYADVLLVVMEPSRKSILTAKRTLGPAYELGIPLVFGVGNKARMPDDGEFFRDVAEEYGVPLAGIVPHDAAVVEVDRTGGVLAPGEAEPVRRAVKEILDFVDAQRAGVEGNGAERTALLRERERVNRRLVELGGEQAG